MSDLLDHAGDCTCTKAPCSSIRYILEPVLKDLGGFSVRRLLPAKDVRAVGPFVFFDHLGPAWFEPGKGIDVRPHPHIGLATITYLFEGEILHRDSLGSVQPIRPKAINWMTAGRGIAHSERTPPAVRSAGHTLHALQLWVALPAADEETDPAFFHYDETELPEFADAEKSLGAKITLPEGVEERAVYLVSGMLQSGGNPLPQHSMVIFDDSPGIEIEAGADSSMVIIGGAPLGRRTVWWNLVSSRKELIEQAKRDWQAGTFPKVPAEKEFIPLP